jgi:hypothetical protein
MLVLSIDQEADVALTITDRAGNPAAIHGVPTWEAADNDVVEIVESDDGRSAVIRSRDVIGETTITAMADADLGEGVEEIRGVLAVAATAGNARLLELQAGAPRPKATV